MKKSIIILFLAFSAVTFGQNLPAGVTKTTNPCNLAKGLFSTYFNKDNNMIAMIEPTGCNYANTDGPQTKPIFQADFYPTAAKKSFPTNDEAVKWVQSEMDNYFKPVIVTKWLSLDNAVPKVSLKYPDGWTIRVAQDDYFAKPVGKDNNKIVITLTQPNGSTEIMQIIRNPNTGKQTTKQFMESTSKINRAIDFIKNPPTDQVIGGKSFKTTENIFAMLMLQRHYWYADDKEVIYIGYGLLKDDRVRYPNVVAEIIKSIKW